MNDWHYMGLGDDNNLYDEEGNSRPMTTADYQFEFGKYNGMKLCDVTDKGYLVWLQESNESKKVPDWYQDRLLTMRIKELS